MALHTLESSHVLPQVQELSVCPRPDLRAKGGSEVVSSLSRSSRCLGQRPVSLMNKSWIPEVGVCSPCGGYGDRLDGLVPSPDAWSVNELSSSASSRSLHVCSNVQIVCMCSLT